MVYNSQANLDISWSPIESQWDSLKYPVQPDRYDHGHI